MARTELDYHPDGSFTVEGPPPETRQGTGERLRAFVLAMNQVKALYKELIADDGKLIGQERYQLIQVIDEALSELIYLRADFEKASKHEFTALNMRYNYKLQVHLKPNRWSGRGMLGVYRAMKVQEFELWLNRIIKERLVKLIQFYAQALSDGILDSRERIVLTRALDRLIFGLILVRINLQSGNVS